MDPITVQHFLQPFGTFVVLAGIALVAAVLLYGAACLWGALRLAARADRRTGRTDLTDAARDYDRRFK